MSYDSIDAARHSYIQARTPHLRTTLASILTDPTVSNINAWHQYQHTSYVTVRDADEMARYGEIRTHGYEQVDLPADIAAYQARLLPEWRRAAASYLRDQGLSDWEAMSRLVQLSYDVSQRVASWATSQYGGH